MHLALATNSNYGLNETQLAHLHVLVPPISCPTPLSLYVPISVEVATENNTKVVTGVELFI